MSVALATSHPMSFEPSSAYPRALDTAIEAAVARIAPLWPLADWVAVNPFLGFSDVGFDAAAQALARLVGARLAMPRAFYREALSQGRMSYEDIAWAAAAANAEGSLADILAAVQRDDAPPPGSVARIATVAEVLDSLASGDRQVSRTAFMVEEIAKWCAAYYDAGAAAWPAPWRGQPLFAAWREAVKYDANPQAMGIQGFRDSIEETPLEAEAAIAFVLQALGIPEEQWTDYLYRALFDIRGWAAFVRRLDWEAARGGGSGRAAIDLLAIRVVWGYALYRQRRDAAFATAWQAAMAAARHARPRDANAELRFDMVLQRAYERGFQRRLFAKLSGEAPAPAAARPALQAVFCIDVRSEVYRRALETLWPDAETLGFAGFFGMPIRYADDAGADRAQCPVLLEPGPAVHACHVPSPPAAALTGAGSLLSKLKASAVSCFGFVEAFGLAYAGKLAVSAAPSGRPPIAPLAPPLSGLDLTLDQRIDMAEGALRGMSLVQGFARLVVLAGHGATTVNNPHAAGLDCGACAGHSGAPNARVAAALLNNAQVRAGLAARGIEIPADTWFVPALHDTTTDAVWLLDVAAVPASHKADLEAAERRFAAASAAAREERAPRLGAASGAALVARSRDWSQVRPEWGLARAAAFIAAPRAATRGRDLEGRAFLHNYDRRLDPDLKILELILTAPMVVASWISLQYYGATVDNAAFGGGDKTLHNVCGGVGVIEGNAGDLRPGLPLQSVHDGQAFVHEPMRLSVFVAADPADIATVLARQPQVRDLLDNGWLHLFALDDQGRAAHRYVGGLSWEAVQ